MLAPVLGCSGPRSETGNENAEGPGGNGHGTAAKESLRPCTYDAKNEVDPDDVGLTSHDACARREGGTLRLEPEHLRALDYGENGLAEVWVDGTWHYVRPGGETLAVLTFDNGPDPYAEGLTRTRRDGKVAYVDQDFQIAVPPRYDFGWPFEDGVALVCDGCTEERDGEHTALVGGSWGYVDRQGVEVVPVKLSRDEAWESRPGG